MPSDDPDHAAKPLHIQPVKLSSIYKDAGVSTGRVPGEPSPHAEASGNEAQGRATLHSPGATARVIPESSRPHRQTDTSENLQFIIGHRLPIDYHVATLKSSGGSV